MAKKPTEAQMLKRRDKIIADIMDSGNKANDYGWTNMAQTIAKHVAMGKKTEETERAWALLHRYRPDLCRELKAELGEAA